MGKLMEKAEKMKLVLQKALKGDPIEDNEALEVKNLYPTWHELVKMGSVESEEGFRFQYKDELYKCIFANPTFQANWVPGSGTESLYARIDETHAGTLEDPIPYEGNMVLTNGLYYSQDEQIYICNRDTGIAVFNPLSELVGLYVQVVS